MISTLYPKKLVTWGQVAGRKGKKVEAFAVRNMKGDVEEIFFAKKI